MALFRKEWRGVLPLALFWWLLWGISLIDETLTTAPDAVSFEQALGLFHESGIVVTLGGAVSLWLACHLIQTEHTNGTLELLDSLPTTRSLVLWNKVAAGLLLLWSGPVLHVGVAYVFCLFDRSTIQLDGPPLGIAIAWMLLVCAALTILFGIALVLSYLRRLTWLAAALLFCAYLVLQEVAPGAAVLDVSALCEPAFEGAALSVPWRQLAVQAPLAAIAYVVAWALYRGAGDWLVRTGERLVESLAGRIAIGAAFALALTLWIVVPMVVVAQSEDGEDHADEHGVVYVSWTTSMAVTEHYTISFPTSLSRTAGALVASADSIHERVRSWFDAEPIGRIDVDATGAGPVMYAGRAFHEALQIDLARAGSVRDLQATFAHETAHLYIDAVANDRTSDVFRWIRCVHEGLANHLEYAQFRPSAEIENVRLHAAVAHSWKPIVFEEFIDDAQLTQSRDPYLVYTVGEVLMAALIEVHGRDAPLRFLRALGREDHPQDVQGIALWRDTCQAAGLDLEEVVNRFLALLDAEVERQAEVVDSLEAPRGRVTEQTENGVDWIGLEPVLDTPPPPGWDVIARFRRDASDGLEDFLYGEDSGGVLWIPRHLLPGRRAEYQLGLLSRERGITVWDLWREASLGR